ncbi:MAG: hypothetical protein K2M94_03705 [Paramuribaculum sp.]|nr:hypothetical protein [Paramuribaculum sp.]
MKKLILLFVLIMGGVSFSTPTLLASPDAPMCTFDDPCLFTGLARSEDGHTINVVVKHNKKGQIVALINGDINKATLCVGVAQSKQYCFTWNNIRYYFSIN